ncbi:MAG: lysophospholipid acyltransferase family protein [Bryobacteraceae bacterium]
MNWLRTYVITPPFSAFCFLSFWLNGAILRLFRAGPLRHHFVARFWSRLLLRTAAIEVRAEGFDKLNPAGIYIFVSNHLSLADTPLMAGWLPFPFRFLAKESLMSIPIVGDHLRWGCHIAVPREDTRGAARSLAEAAKLLRKRAASVLVFAEGTRGSGQLQPFKPGAAHLALHTGVPVVPLAIEGTAAVMPRRALLLRPGTVRLIAGDVIATAGRQRTDPDAFTEELRESVKRLLEAGTPHGNPCENMYTR